MSRPLICGPESPEAPFPITMRGVVSKGFGRGSKELGIPTANLPEQVSESVSKKLETGIYYGYAGVGSSSTVFPMVMEVHIIHQFDSDFYGQELRVAVLGWIRPELNYTTLGKAAALIGPEALIEDINTDIKVAHESLKRPGYQQYKDMDFFTAPGK
ncbi:riboflavin kinase [Kappamyces sp. JEL0680]|nr:riboflavin kinase [Kappamyces sp. JEL0680]